MFSTLRPVPVAVAGQLGAVAGRDRLAERALRGFFNRRKIAEVHPQAFVARIGAHDDVANFRQA